MGESKKDNKNSEKDIKDIKNKTENSHKIKK